MDRAGRLEPIDVNRKYPKGTLVIIDFSDVETDQGHVAVVIDESGDNILDQRIIHSYATVDYTESKNKKNAGKTGTMKFKSSHYFASVLGLLFFIYKK